MALTIEDLTWCIFMEYTFVLTVGKELSKLALHKGEEVISEEEWQEERDMGRQLFFVIEKLLAQVGIAPQEVSLFRIVSDLPDSSTSRRIAETVASVYTFGVQASDSMSQEE